jgi:hypothetical protein
VPLASRLAVWFMPLSLTRIASSPEAPLAPSAERVAGSA